MLADWRNQIGRERETLVHVILARYAGSHDGIETEAGFPGAVDPKVEAVRNSWREAELNAGSIFLGPGVVADREVHRADSCLMRERTLELDDVVPSQTEMRDSACSLGLLVEMNRAREPGIEFVAETAAKGLGSPELNFAGRLAERDVQGCLDGGSFGVVEAIIVDIRRDNRDVARDFLRQSGTRSREAGGADEGEKNTSTHANSFRCSRYCFGVHIRGTSGRK
jgi:hypothetical protein